MRGWSFQIKYHTWKHKRLLFSQRSTTFIKGRYSFACNNVGNRCPAPCPLRRKLFDAGTATPRRGVQLQVAIALPSLADVTWTVTTTMSAIGKEQAYLPDRMREREGLAHTRTSVPNDFRWAMFFRGAESATERRVRRSRAAATTWQIEDYRKAGTVCGKRQRWSRLLSVKCALPLWHVTPLCQHDHNLTLMLSSFPSSKLSLKNKAHRSLATFLTSNRWEIKC